MRNSGFQDMALGQRGFFSPVQIPNCALWLDAADTSTITQVAGAVSQWNDKSGNGNNVTQPTGANKPVTGTTTINGVNGIAFDGTASFMLLPNGLYTIPNGNNTVLIARTATFAPSAGASKRLLNAQDGGSNRYFLGSSNPSGTSFFNYTNGVNGTAVTGANFSSSPAIEAFVRSGVNETAYINGTGGQTNALATSFTATQFNLGCQTTSANNPFQGPVGEILLYNAALTAAQLDAAGSYLAAKWGISWTNI